MNAKDFLEEIDYYNTNVDGEIFEDLGIETLADILEVYHQRKLKLLGIGVVSQQREQLKAFLQYVNCSDTDSKVSFELLDEYLNSL